MLDYVFFTIYQTFFKMYHVNSYLVSVKTLAHVGKSGSRGNVMGCSSSCVLGFTLEVQIQQVYGTSVGEIRHVQIEKGGSKELDVMLKQNPHYSAPAMYLLLSARATNVWGHPH